MKRLSFTVLVPGGTADTVREGTVVDLLLSVPYLLSDRILPPLHVLNEILATGEIAAGMSGGCRWQPLAVTPQEFEELVLILSERVDGPAVKYVEPPAWVGTLEEWRHWTSEYCYGIPAQRNLEFSRRLRALDDVRKAAEAEGDHELLGSVLSELVDASAEYSRWVLQHRRPHVGEGAP